MPPTKQPRRNLREACVAEALAIIDEAGLEQLSLREVARRLGVSHWAPYKHFASRDHILAEIVARAFAAFAAHLDRRPLTGSPPADLAAMGRAYLDYALAHPLNYRLMFGTPLPDPAAHPDMLREARHAFSLLKEALAGVHAASGQEVDGTTLDRDAIFIWSTLHGLATIMRGDAIRQIGVDPAVLAAMPEHALGRIGTALGIAEGLNGPLSDQVSAAFR